MEKKIEKGEDSERRGGGGRGQSWYSRRGELIVISEINSKLQGTPRGSTGEEGRQILKEHMGGQSGQEECAVEGLCTTDEDEEEDAASEAPPPPATCSPGEYHNTASSVPEY